MITRADLSDLPDDLKAAPGHLTEVSRNFFVHVTGTIEFDAPAGALLIRFLEVRDQLAKARAELAALGGSFTFLDKHNQPRIHPLVKHELALSNEYGKLFRLLGWDQAPPADQGTLFIR